MGIMLLKSAPLNGQSSGGGLPGPARVCGAGAAMESKEKDESPRRKNMERRMSGLLLRREYGFLETARRV
jgi:hypothetical protein